MINDLRFLAPLEMTGTDSFRTDWPGGFIKFIREIQVLIPKTFFAKFPLDNGQQTFVNRPILLSLSKVLSECILSSVVRR